MRAAGNTGPGSAGGVVNADVIDPGPLRGGQAQFSAGHSALDYVEILPRKQTIP